MPNEDVFAMSHGEAGDALPDAATVDSLMNGGEPNQEVISYEDPGVDENPIDKLQAESNKTPEPSNTNPNAKPEAPAIDPIVQKLSEAIKGLTAEQRAQLISAPLELTHNGQKLSIPADKQVPLIQMALNYSDKMRAFNAEKEQFRAQIGQVGEKEKYYGEIDRVAKSNPEWWAHVQDSFKNFQAKGTTEGTPAAGNLPPEMRAALSKITEWEQKQQVIEDQKLAEVQKSEDAQLTEYMQAFQKENPEQDWLTADDKGHTLADRIVLHASKNGINNFRAAARDYLYEDKMARAKVQSKEELKKTIQTQTRSGVVIKGKPSGLKPPSSITRSYDDLINEGYAEIGS